MYNFFTVSYRRHGEDKSLGVTVTYPNPPTKSVIPESKGDLVKKVNSDFTSDFLEDDPVAPASDKEPALYEVKYFDGLPEPLGLTNSTAEILANRVPRIRVFLHRLTTKGSQSDLNQLEALLQELHDTLSSVPVRLPPTAASFQTVYLKSALATRLEPHATDIIGGLENDIIEEYEEATGESLSELDQQWLRSTLITKVILGYAERYYELSQAQLSANTGHQLRACQLTADRICSLVSLIKLEDSYKLYGSQPSDEPDLSGLKDPVDPVNCKEEFLTPLSSSPSRPTDPLPFGFYGEKREDNVPQPYNPELLSPEELALEKAPYPRHLDHSVDLPVESFDLTPNPNPLLDREGNRFFLEPLDSTQEPVVLADLEELPLFATNIKPLQVESYEPLALPPYALVLVLMEKEGSNRDPLSPPQKGPYLNTTPTPVEMKVGNPAFPAFGLFALNRRLLELLDLTVLTTKRLHCVRPLFLQYRLRAILRGVDPYQYQQLRAALRAQADLRKNPLPNASLQAKEQASVDLAVKNAKAILIREGTLVCLTSKPGTAGLDDLRMIYPDLGATKAFINCSLYTQYEPISLSRELEATWDSQCTQLEVNFLRSHSYFPLNLGDFVSRNAYGFLKISLQYRSDQTPEKILADRKCQYYLLPQRLHEAHVQHSMIPRASYPLTSSTYPSYNLRPVLTDYLKCSARSILWLETLFPVQTPPRKPTSERDRPNRDRPNRNRSNRNRSKD